MPRKNYNYAKHFKAALDGPNPFFVIRTYLPYHYEKPMLKEKLLAAAGDGFLGIHDYAYNFDISYLIEKKVLPEAASVIDKYFDQSHLLVSCKFCIETIQEVFKVLDKETRLWSLVAFVHKYNDNCLSFARLVAERKVRCKIPGHPSHKQTTSGLRQVKAEKENENSVVETTASEELESAELKKLCGNHVIDKDFDSDWDVVEQLLQTAYSCKCSEEVTSLFQNQRQIENLKNHVTKMAEHHPDSFDRIYDRLRQSMGSHLISVYRAMDADNEDLFLSQISANWDRFSTLIWSSVLVFGDVGPFFTSYLLGLHLWELNVLQAGLIKILVTRLRHAEVVATPFLPQDYFIANSVVRKLAHMVGRYCPFAKQILQQGYLDQSQKFYEDDARRTKLLCCIGPELRGQIRELSTEYTEAGKGQVWAEYMKCFQEYHEDEVVHLWDLYFTNVEEYCDEEVKLAKIVLDNSFQQKLLSAFVEEYFTNQTEWLWQCFNKAFEIEQYGSVCMMNKLLRRFPSGSTVMKSILVTHVAETLRLVLHGSHEASNGKCLIRMSSKYEHVIRESLENDSIHAQTVKICFRKALTSTTEYAESVLSYMDSMLREGHVLNLEAESEVKEAYKFIVHYFGAEMFDKFYQRYMAGQLIDMACSGSMQRCEVDRLNFNSSFALEKMILDVESSQQISDGFRSTFPSSTQCPEVSFMVLDPRCWPFKQRQQLHLPADLCPAVDNFNSHYMGIKSNKSKKLLLQTNLGCATLEASFLGKESQELIVSTPQMCILMLFNTVTSLSYRDIREGTGMTDDELQQCLPSLAAVDGTGILNLKRHGVNEFSEHDMLALNENFNGNLNLSLSMKHDFEPVKLAESVHEAEKNYVEAAIARIVKAKNSIDHRTLIKEVTDALYPRFTTTTAVIKERIEHLINHTCLLKRDDDGQGYSYIP